jgi:predicted transposase/invertase (TIGR01784 family)
MGKISPRVDVAFKKIFGVEENKDLLISLINSIVGPEDQVSTLTLLNPYNPKNFRGDKISILDIKAQGKDGKRFNIEIQISDEADYDKRALYYWAKLYTEQLKVADDYALLSKAIGIHILNFISIPQVTKYHNVFHIREQESNLHYFKDLELHTIELKKFCATPQEDLVDLLEKVKTSLDMWVAFLTRHDLLKKDHLPAHLNDPSLQKALHVLDVMNFGPEEKEAYEDHLKWLRIEMNTLKKAEERGKQEGKEIGIQEGRELGIQEGEKKKSLEIAQTMLQQGYSIQQVIQITKLSETEIKLLEQNEILR